MLDPNDPQYDPKPGGGNFTDLKTPGVYILGCRKLLKHDETPNGKRFARLAFVVLNGSHKGESFVDRIFTSPSAYKRLAMFNRAMRYIDPSTKRLKKWDPSNKTEVEAALVGHAFKASVTINDNGFAELKYPEPEPTADEIKVMEAWEKDFKRERAKQLEQERLSSASFGDDDDPGPTGPDDFGGSDFGDDDIPF